MKVAPGHGCEAWEGLQGIGTDGLEFQSVWFCQQTIDTITQYIYIFLSMHTYFAVNFFTLSILVLFLLYIMDLGTTWFLVYIYLGCCETFKIIYIFLLLGLSDPGQGCQDQPR